MALTREKSTAKEAKATPAIRLRADTFGSFLRQQHNRPLLRFIACGGVGDGKSTVIGRLQWESQQLSSDQFAAPKKDSRKCGNQGDSLDFALLVNGLAAEREQGTAIVVAYRLFSSTQREFIAIDTPGHEQCTRHIVAGASAAAPVAWTATGLE